MHHRLILLFTLVLFLSPICNARISDYCSTCERDSHGHIKRSLEAKHAFKREHPCPSNGKTKGRCEGYIVDHIIALKRGGVDAASNMQWQTIKESRAKDAVE